MTDFEGSRLILKKKSGDLVLDHAGSKYAKVLTSDLVGKSFTVMFPPALKPVQMSLIMPCVRQNIGIVRTSRVWFGHRHKDVELLLLPVTDSETGKTALVGRTGTFVDSDERDYVSVGSSMVERIMRQDFLSLGGSVDLSVIDSHGWAVLDTMDAKIAIDGAVVTRPASGIVGEAGLVASKVAHANVLAVANPSDFGRLLSRLGARYNLKIVATMAEARSILQSDMIDVLVTSETVNDVAGIELIRETQAISAFTACVLMLDRQESAEDIRTLNDGNFVQYLVKPVGEFALRQALDAANQYVVERRHADINARKL